MFVVSLFISIPLLIIGYLAIALLVVAAVSRIRFARDFFFDNEGATLSVNQKETLGWMSVLWPISLAGCLFLGVFFGLMWAILEIGNLMSRIVAKSLKANSYSE
jgi:hypothetical protein